MEQLANNPVTTLDGAINSVVTSLVVTSASAFPTSGNFTIKIESELLRVTAVSGTTFTVARGSEGTTAASHADDVLVSQVVTELVMKNLYAEFYQIGAYASRPTAVRNGTIYHATDIDLIWQYDGTNWNLIKPGYVEYAHRVDASGWTSLNFGSSVWTDINGVLLVEGIAGETQVRGKYKALPSAPFTAYVAVGTLAHQQNNHVAGILLYDTGTTKCKIFGVSSYANGERATLLTYATPSSAGTFVGQQDVQNFPIMWYKFEDDNTNWKYSFSTNGTDFTQFYSEARNTFLTPTNIGLATWKDASTTFSNSSVFTRIHAYWEA